MAGAGDLRHRIVIRRRVEDKNAGGGLNVSWQTIGTVWAAIKSMNGREAVTGNVLQGISMFELTIRFREDLRAADQLLWGTRELNVINAEDRVGDRTWTVIQASTSAPQGA